jgi:hypothetical protein
MKTIATRFMVLAPRAMLSCTVMFLEHHRRAARAICFLTAFLFAAIASGISAQNVSFPGTRSQSKSPDGRFVIKNFDSDTENPAHTLTLLDHRMGTEVKIYRYGRGVDVLWSPNSKAFVINDHEGSNVSHPVLFMEPWSTHFTDLRESLIDFLRSRNEAKSLLDNDHVYITGERWLDSDKILCKVTGYGDADPQGFTQHYVYKIGVGFRSYK